MTHKTSNEQWKQQSFFLNLEWNFSSRQKRTLQKRRGMKNEILMQFVKTWPSGSWNTSFQITCSTSFSKVPNKCAIRSFILLIFNHFLSFFTLKIYHWSDAYETLSRACFSLMSSILNFLTARMLSRSKELLWWHRTLVSKIAVFNHEIIFPV